MVFKNCAKKCLLVFFPGSNYMFSLLLLEKELTLNRARQVFEFGGYRVMKFIAGPNGEDKQAYENADDEAHSNC